MPRSRPTFPCLVLFAALTFVKGAQAATADPFTSAGSRMGIFLTQQMLASPPLPSPDENKNRKITFQAGYLDGKIRGTYALDSTTTIGYHSKPKGYAYGLGYTSQSRGKFSYFGYLLYSSLKGDMERDPVSGAVWGIKNNLITGWAGALALNYIVLGELNSAINAGIFLGAQGIRVGAEGKWGQLNYDPLTGSAPNEPMGMSSKSYGPLTGIQVKLQWKRAVLVPYGLYFHDVTDHCTDVSYTTIGVSAEAKCYFKVDSSYAAAGLMIGYGNLRANVLSNVWSNIDKVDTKSSAYKISYAIEF